LKRTPVSIFLGRKGRIVRFEQRHFKRPRRVCRRPAEIRNRLIRGEK
jgi:hypothetical protein